MNRTHGRSAEFSNGKKTALYFFFMTGLAVLYGIYIPCLLDYYIVRPEQSFLSFFHENFLKAPYTFEGILIGMALALLYALTLRAGVSVLAVSAALFVLTHASYIKFINRRELLRLDDLRLTEAAGMALGYLRFTLDRFLVLTVGILLVFAGAGFAADWLGRRMHMARILEWPWRNSFGEETGPERAPDKLRVTLLGVRLGAVLVLGAGICLYTDFFLGREYAIDAIEPLSPESDRYVLYRFLRNDSLSQISVEQAEESYAFLLSQSPPRRQSDAGGGTESPDNTAADASDAPTVIVIMNESWWNTDNIRSDRVTFSKDPMGPYKALADRCATGYVTSPVFGGGTVRPEIEFLTGLNTKYYNADSAYDGLRERKVPSVADYFKELGYETVAIHPYYGSFYGRDAVYEAMGFDQVIFEDDVQYREIYTRYISDESLAKEIIARSQREGGGPAFIWAVSIANHSRVLDYHVEAVTDYDYPIEVTVEGEPLDREEYDSVVNYINGIYMANLAFAQLVEYFSETGRPTVIMMFGDHCPYFSAETLDAFGLDGEGAKDRLYVTPVILWSNLSGEKPNFSGESMYYLPMMLVDHAGLPDCDMARILRYERSYFKTNSLNFVRDASGQIFREGTEEQLRALGHCKVVQYDLLFGEGPCRDVWRPDTAFKGEPERSE